MTYQTAQVHWYEGMFLQTHHFQAAERRQRCDAGEQAALAPYWWGVSSLDIDNDALEGYRFKVNHAALRLRNGTWLNIPRNAVIQETSFFDALQVLDSSGVIAVWMGVRKFESHRALVQPYGEEETSDRPYVVREVTLADENTGDNEQIVQVRLWNAKIFFGEPPGDEFEVIKIGEITRSATERPAFNLEYIPAMVKLSVSPGLKERLVNLVVHLNNQAAYLRHEIADKKALLMSDPVNILSGLLRLQTVASFGMVLGQLQAADETHPHQVYLELVRLIGNLSALSPETNLEGIKNYDHDALNDVFQALLTTAWTMLKGGLVADYTERTFEIKGESRVCRIDREWLEAEFSAYLCINADDPEAEVDAVLSDRRVKVGTPNLIAGLQKQRIKGIAFERIRRVPTGLQDRSGLHYFRFDMSRGSKFWEDLHKELLLEIRGIPASVIPDMKLYVHIQQKEKFNAGY